MRGAGGTPGGSWQFFGGLVMAAVGAYLLLHNITVSHAFGWGSVLYRVPYGSLAGGGFGITAGALLVPFLAGVGVIFYDSKKVLGWALSGGALTAMVLGVLMSLRFSLRAMSLLELLTLLTLLVGGLGLFARSLRSS